MKTQVYENYIWDLGGTLLDNYESSARAFALALWETAERVSIRSEIYQALKISTAHAVETFASDIPDFLAIYKRLEAQTLTKPILMDGAKEVLESLSARGCRHFMISHRDRQVLQILQTAGIENYFVEVVTADNGFPRKPAPDSCNYLLQKYQLDPTKTVMIGDRALDIQAGNRAGCASIFFDTTASNPEATSNISSLRQLI